MERFGFDIDKNWEYENGFYLTGHVTRIAKLLSHYELYNRIVNLPGHIAEFGVFKGVSFIQWLTFREILESPFSRRVFGFDMFGEFPKDLTLEADINYSKKHDEISGFGIPKDDLGFYLEKKNFQNYELIEGDIMVTLQDFLEKNPQYRFSLVHIDVDVYKPSKVILDLIVPHMVRGGILVFDDYNAVLGETMAIEENPLLKEYPIQKLSISHIPAFIVVN
jgi:hypothetical protein